MVRMRLKIVELTSIAEAEGAADGLLAEEGASLLGETGAAIAEGAIVEGALVAAVVAAVVATSPVAIGLAILAGVVAIGDLLYHVLKGKPPMPNQSNRPREKEDQDEKRDMPTGNINTITAHGAQYKNKIL